MPDNSKKEIYSSVICCSCVLPVRFLEYLLCGRYWLYAGNTDISRTRISFLPKRFKSESFFKKIKTV